MYWFCIGSLLIQTHKSNYGELSYDSLWIQSQSFYLYYYGESQSDSLSLLAVAWFCINIVGQNLDSLWRQRLKAPICINTVNQNVIQNQYSVTIRLIHTDSYSESVQDWPTHSMISYQFTAMQWTTIWSNKYTGKIWFCINTVSQNESVSIQWVNTYIRCQYGCERL